MPHYIEPKKPKVGGTGPMGTVGVERVKRVILTPGPGAKNAVGLLCSKNGVSPRKCQKTSTQTNGRTCMDLKIRKD